MAKDWDKIVRELSDPEDSDEGDVLNEVMVRKNAQRLADVMHHYLPGLDPSNAQSEPRTTPLGTTMLRDALQRASQVGLGPQHGVDDGREDGGADGEEELGEEALVAARDDVEGMLEDDHPRGGGGEGEAVLEASRESRPHARR